MESQTLETNTATQPQTISQQGNGALPVPANQAQRNASPRAQAFELAQRAAGALSKSSLVPEAYRGNIANCLIALNIAERIGSDPLMVMQNLDIVHGRPTWRAQFLIGTVNNCGRFSSIRYEFFGERDKDSWGCRAWAIEKSTGEKLIGPDITIALAKVEGWHGKSGSKWKTMPQLMLMYRAGSWWTRAYAPELSLGFQTAEEAHDVLDATVRDDGSYGVDALKQAQAQLGAAPVEETPHDPETGEIIEQETIDDGEDVLAEDAAADPLASLSAELAQLAQCTATGIVDRLEKEVGARLVDQPETLQAWTDACAAKASEIMNKGKKK